jgi:hypothetical protein
MEPSAGIRSRIVQRRTLKILISMMVGSYGVSPWLPTTGQSLCDRSCAAEVTNEGDAAVALQAGQDSPATAAEARGRSRLLHEAIHGTLQVVHRDFFLGDESITIPSRSFEDVFRELARSHSVDVRWLIVNADALNVDHEPHSEFEKQAAKSLGAGKQEFDSVENGVFRYAGAIRLSSQCLKCHVANRTSTKDRAAGLVISMPLRKTDPQGDDASHELD